jgi:hypothetical protein
VGDVAATSSPTLKPIASSAAASVSGDKLQGFFGPNTHFDFGGPSATGQWIREGELAYCEDIQTKEKRFSVGDFVKLGDRLLPLSAIFVHTLTRRVELMLFDSAKGEHVATSCKQAQTDKTVHIHCFARTLCV